MSARSQVGIDMELFGVRFRPADFEHIQDRLVRIDRVEFQFQFGVGDPGEIKQIGDELTFQLDIAADHRQRSL